jgi:hypothetical protein
MTIDGPYRQALGHRQSHSSFRPGTRGRTGPSVDGSSHGPQRDSLDLENWSAVGRSAEALRELPDGSSEITSQTFMRWLLVLQGDIQYNYWKNGGG